MEVESETKNPVGVARERLSGALLYAASARRVLRAQGVANLAERVRRDEQRLVFVMGSPRSGTTFLAGQIGAVPGFVDLTEVNPHKAAIPGLVGEPTDVAARHIRRILDRVRTLSLVRGLRAVEQTPETAFVLAAALHAYPEARAVHIVRDGRDVVCSLLERGWLRAGRAGGDDARLTYGAGARFWVESDRVAEFESASDATRAAWAWRRYVSAARGVVDDRVLEVRYEEMANDPARVASAISAHLGVDSGPLTANLARFHDRSIGRYVRDLDEAALADVENEAGGLLRELGYR